MADPTARTLQLLSLLQRRRHWRGDELAGRLEVSERTLRRDIDRLRWLGYTVSSTPGLDGGYRLEAGTEAVPLLLSDDEAVALAVSLHVTSHETMELAEASVGALAKVLATLPPAQRRRAETIRSSIVTAPRNHSGTPSLATMAAVADACRDRVRLTFGYRAADGTETERRVEPSGMVALGGRWYLVAFDLTRDDWRTFRVDRMADPEPARTPVPERRPPAEDLHAYVRERLSGLTQEFRVTIDVDLPAEVVQRRYGRWAEVAPRGDGGCRITMEVDSFEWPTHMLTDLDAPFVVHEPVQLVDHLRAVAARLAGARSTA